MVWFVIGFTRLWKETSLQLNHGDSRDRSTNTARRGNVLEHKKKEEDISEILFIIDFVCSNYKKGKTYMLIRVKNPNKKVVTRKL